MTETDPTTDFLTRLADPALFRFVGAVPVVRPHSAVVQDKPRHYGLEEMEEFVAETLKAERESGVVLRLTLGHLRLNEPETSPLQPPIVGYARNPRLGTFGPTNVPCVLVDEYVKRDCWDEAKQYPYRSIEFFPTTRPLRIRGVALLKRDPYLDLGMVAYSFPERSNVADEKKEPEAKKPEAPASAPAPAPAAPAAPGDLAPEDAAKADAYMGHYQSKHPWVGYAMKCYDASAAAASPAAAPATPSPTNVSPAGTKPEDMARMQHDQQAVHYAQLEARVKAAEAQLAQERTEKTRAVCEQLVIQLEAEGYQLDRPTEVGRLAAMDEAGREAHKANVRKFYKQIPLGQAPFRTYDHGPTEGGIASQPRGITQDEQQGAVRLAGKLGCEFDEALTKYRAGQR